MNLTVLEDLSTSLTSILYESLADSGSNYGLHFPIIIMSLCQDDNSNNMLCGLYRNFRELTEKLTPENIEDSFIGGLYKYNMMEAPGAGMGAYLYEGEYQELLQMTNMSDKLNYIDKMVDKETDGRFMVMEGSGVVKWIKYIYQDLAWADSLYDSYPEN